ncbi:Bacteroides conjugative transposon TraK protein [Mucilaginibacter gossypiicola]|uniref:Bacteroides conjugative transposon TraK protein n=1 Tax=Mucilaginibacter gossypiicola TaxID=551995 RepID=A0A1H8HMR5_9SPHI|nr:conjugative transposon protein TraK [Mucilaginibacter gossypiicola]SEN57492.1 Bacteroides conjugative transposon TraK protein [Mucilaginibacter gossypiicola]
MFTKAKNIDTAFKQTRSFFILLTAGTLLLCSFIVYKCFRMVSGAQGKIYVLASGKAMEALAEERKDNIPVEAKDHIATFHHYFFTLSPDDKQILASITQAMYFGDGSVKRAYDNLKESNYYSNIIAGNVSQIVKTDSISVNTTEYPYYFRYYGKEEITRATTVVSRSLITEGYLRNVDRSDNNSHGFLIERWQILENKDLNVKNR